MKAGEASRTAVVVAGGVVFAAGSAKLSNEVDLDAARLTRLLLMSTHIGRRLLKWIDWPPTRIALQLIERLTIPGIVRHWVCRKRFLEQAWQAAHAEGFDTLLVLGCGFDTLSLRVAQRCHGQVQTVDVDHPDTLGCRQSGLASISVPSHLLVAHDLGRHGLGNALSNAIPAESCVFVVIEGVLMYLAQQRVDELFDELAALKTSRLRVAFTMMECTADSPPAFRPRSRLIDLWLRMRGEPFRSGLDINALESWVSHHHFRLINHSVTPGRQIGTSRDLRGEFAAVADRIERAPG